ncbi:beta-lactam-binding protein with PASTA domain/tRNA A-37 threonylcarbamoyl transferase component Bud32 [Paenibacillus sp. V4I3]|uniref:Stk1 family PASTA domain-containing Ser/Thr kinase n=1 Tax=Paenibacillus sp. V4I3 TaxID=3042305 RepID=UPI002785B62C|nr:Stk1 family PASTA domain-containing Ser/Thr kinase [Paenibacillus sp. V4I3]MDQ0876617.1 beta-lactam-binding protein with PASTA domain/tRNA A-37 threonylcarbamoyl transferase component Bud32 [Paenibacillus sp. V4I3]
MIGRKLGGRYEILDRIGGGGMALVYKGHDLLLNRKVAVKVLRQQYVHDEEFIRRFRREAQAAASLSHPNIVSIYDVGQEEDVHYIVMEYIEGTTLNDVIKERAPLQVEDAVHYASQIADALDHAHHNEIIHRDIKPHNILIGKNGRVKVTDFGIARAATSSTITQTGSVVGSVHYFSPEHAKGTNTGEKSDLYSLGIVMYQMLTARLPFLGESPISVALKHLQEDVEEPRKVNPLIPQSVENIILRAMRKKPEERYQSAKLMMADLDTCLNPDRRNEAKVAFWDADGMDEERTLVMPAIRADQLGQFEDDDEPEKPAWREEPAPSKGKGWIKPLIWIVVLLMVLGAMWYMVGYVKGMFAIETVEVPNVAGKPLIQAQAELTAVKLSSTVEYDLDSKLAKDIVIRQDPTGMRMNLGTKVTLYVSKGMPKIKMDNYAGQPFKDVKLKLQALGIKDDQITITQETTDGAPDMILKQSPLAGEEFELDKAVIAFTVSKAKETFKMPDLVGMTEAEAKAQLTKLNLKLPVNGITREKSYKVAKGKVVKQFPFEKNQDVSVGSEISLIISDGLPEDAGQLAVSIAVKPTTEGKDSEFKIVVSDAQYENFEYKTEKVSKPQNMDVKVIVSPDKKAVILIKEGDNLVNSITRTYQDYLDQKNGKTVSPSPSTSPSPSPKQQSNGPAIPVGGTGNGQTGGTVSKPPAGGTP